MALWPNWSIASGSIAATPTDTAQAVYWEQTDTNSGNVGNVVEVQSTAQRVFIVPAGFFPSSSAGCATAANDPVHSLPLWRRFLQDLLGYSVACNAGDEMAPKYIISRTPPDFHPYLGSQQYPWVCTNASWEPYELGDGGTPLAQVTRNYVPCVSSSSVTQTIPVQRLMKITATYTPVDFWCACDSINGFNFICPGCEAYRYTTWTNQANAQLLQVGQGKFQYCTNANARGCPPDLIVPWNPSVLVGTNTINIVWHQVPQSPTATAIQQFIPPNADFLQQCLGCLNLYNWPDPRPIGSGGGPWPAGTLLFNNYETIKMYPPRWSIFSCNSSSINPYGDLYFDIMYQIVSRNAGPVPTDYPYYQCTSLSGSSVGYAYTLDQSQGWNWFYRPEIQRQNCSAVPQKYGDFDLATGGILPADQSSSKASVAGTFNGSKLYNRYVDFNLLFTIDPVDWAVTSGTEYKSGCTAPGQSTNLGGPFGGLTFSPLSAGTFPTCCNNPATTCDNGSSKPNCS